MLPHLREVIVFVAVEVALVLAVEVGLAAAPQWPAIQQDSGQFGFVL